MSDGVENLNVAEENFTKDALIAYIKASPWHEAYAISDLQIEQMATYAKMLVEKNKVMNLTAITDVEGIAEKHIHDSLTALPALDRLLETNKTIKVADVGTGAGLPGVILKIMRPEIEVYLIDSLAKRIRFLEDVSEQLGFEDCHCLHLRAEDAGRSAELRANMDFVIARAVAELRILVEYCIPLLKEGGIFLAMKGKLDSEVLDAKGALFLLGGTIVREEAFDLAGSDMSRSLIEIKKVKTTPKIYPRAAGKLQKKPL